MAALAGVLMIAGYGAQGELATGAARPEAVRTVPAAASADAGESPTLTHEHAARSGGRLAEWIDADWTGTIRRTAGAD